jgi:hypothetical protein
MDKSVLRNYRLAILVQDHMLAARQLAFLVIVLKIYIFFLNMINVIWERFKLKIDVFNF